MKDSINEVQELEQKENLGYGAVDTEEFEKLKVKIQKRPKTGKNKRIIKRA